MKFRLSRSLPLTGINALASASRRPASKDSIKVTSPTKPPPLTAMAMRSRFFCVATADLPDFAMIENLVAPIRLYNERVFQDTANRTIYSELRRLATVVGSADTVPVIAPFGPPTWTVRLAPSICHQPSCFSRSSLATVVGSTLGPSPDCDTDCSGIT